MFSDSSPGGCENCWVLSPMRKIPKPSPTASPLLFELDPEPLEETLTALGGIPLVVQAFRSLGAAAEYPGARARERAGTRL